MLATLKQSKHIKSDLKELLESKYYQYNNLEFVQDDPIMIPHLFNKKEDIEVSGFFSATLAWGQRKTIIKNTRLLMTLMDDAPHDFILNHASADLKKFAKFVHRTFNGQDCIFFIQRLSYIYKKQGGLEHVFSIGLKESDEQIEQSIVNFRKTFFGKISPNRTFKHISNPQKNSSSKRICMFLRWMVRKDKKGCDFGIWSSIKPHQLCMPLDVHTGRVSRELGLLKRKQDDWKSVLELTSALREFDHRDPVKYDFALFGMGVSKEL